jgi:hypothetical protein
LIQTAADDLDVTVASTIPKIRKEIEETALTTLSLTVLPNLFRGCGDGRVERRFQVENLESQFEGKGGERLGQKARRDAGGSQARHQL